MKKILKKAAAGLCAAAMLCGSALPALPEEISLLAPALTASAATKEIKKGVCYSLEDTIDFGNGAYYYWDEYFIYDDDPPDDGYIANRSGTCTLTLCEYHDEYSQYLFKLGTSDLWICSEQYTDVWGIEVTDGDGTLNSPYQFAVQRYAPKEIKKGAYYSPGDTIDFGDGAYYYSDDAGDRDIDYQSGTCTLTLCEYYDEYSQYLFKLGTSALWITSEQYSEVSYIYVTDGDGTLYSPYQFEVRGCFFYEDDYCFSVAGTEVTSFNKDDILKNGIFSYDPDTKTLFVKGDYTNTKDCPLIDVGYYWDLEYYEKTAYTPFGYEPLTINVTTDSVLCGSKGIYIDTIFGGGELGYYDHLQVTLTGEGKLNLNTTEYGIMMNCSRVNVIDADVTITSQYGITELSEDYFEDSNVYIENSYFKINADDALDFAGFITFKNARMVKPNGLKASRMGDAGELKSFWEYTEIKQVECVPTAPATITYKGNGASTGDVVTSHTPGGLVELYTNSFKRAGYSFTGWNSKADGSGNTYQPGQEVGWYDNVTLYAQWKQNQSTITYKANGGSGADVVQTHGSGSAATLKPANTFSRSGYVFAGWNSKADGSGNTYAAGKEVKWYDNVTLYAVWKPERTITYKGNGASSADVKQTHGAGEKVKLYSSNFKRTGYTFTGWNSKADGSGNTYQPGKEVAWYNNVTLYAQWKQNQATITYKANGASGSDVVQSHGAGSSATLKASNTFTRSGYVFAGWNSKADGSGNTYQPGKEVKWYDNVTLYAVWKPERTITYKGNGASSADVKQTHGAGLTVKLYTSNFKRTGYTFTGWNSKADGSGNTYLPGQEVAWVDNVTLYAQWEKTTSTITYKANGAAGGDIVQSHYAGEKINLMPAGVFTRSGYTFQGWNSKADGSGNTYAAGKEVAWYDNVTLYAIWKKN